MKTLFKLTMATVFLGSSVFAADTFSLQCNYVSGPEDYKTVSVKLIKEEPNDTYVQVLQTFKGTEEETACTLTESASPMKVKCGADMYVNHYTLDGENSSWSALGGILQVQLSCVEI